MQLSLQKIFSNESPILKPPKKQQGPFLTPIRCTEIQSPNDKNTLLTKSDRVKPEAEIDFLHIPMRREVAKSMFNKPSTEIKRQFIEAIDANLFFEGTEEARAEELTKLLMIAGVNTENGEAMEKARKVIESFAIDGPASPEKKEVARPRKPSNRKEKQSMMHLDRDKSIK